MNRVTPVCPKCGHEFAVAKVGDVKRIAESAEYAVPFRLNGRLVYLTLLTCNICGEKIVVQADNAKSLETVAHMRDLLVAIDFQVDSKSQQRLSERYKASKKKLETIRASLKDELVGKTVTDKHGNVIKTDVHDEFDLR